MDRRAFIAGGVAIAGAGGLGVTPVMATSQAHREWYTTLARWKVAEAAANAYAKANFIDNDDGDCDEMDRLDVRESSLRRQLMETPAPDRAALRWRLDHVLADDSTGYSSSWDNAYIEQTRRDISRLLGDA